MFREHSVLIKEIRKREREREKNRLLPTLSDWTTQTNTNIAMCYSAFRHLLNVHTDQMFVNICWLMWAENAKPVTKMLISSSSSCFAICTQYTALRWSVHTVQSHAYPERERESRHLHMTVCVPFSISAGSNFDVF